ncbi:hypothetical protein T11_12869 [Trichinella zimbabwensis]|uniref:Uncharacterized protein n=1 Tax=Trichinella zimbabwensis TaxID=268475 RepID=A0A0V1I2Z2_9BILA|nr:hypothetical protein T11_12869 [Trichinella zimbabwensis]
MHGLTPKTHQSPPKYQCPCYYSSSTSVSFAMPGTDIQIKESIIKRKAWGSMRHQGIDKGSMV